MTPTEPVPLEELGRVHFVGIGGAGMSGIARIMLARGTEVSGSDSAASAALDELAALGARVHVGHAAGQLGDADTLVVSSAIRDEQPGARRGQAARPAGAAPGGRAGVADVRPPGHRGDRDPRQDDHHVDDHDRAA